MDRHTERSAHCNKDGQMHKGLTCGQEEMYMPVCMGGWMDSCSMSGQMV